ncbi:hypothetical protein [Pyrobaculum ferrireducens]|uniref:PaREP5ab n=1 Tax=Pyrobaculum ferrireducens TaxID=1104324 RepID=G7VEJ9_9CREN|nr:hypothetical protein [Pyrobaculum ferrireducens]AET31623.1 paREP5ab [Pyrobaculum ferrireducens]
MVNVDVVISSLIAQAPLVAAAVIVLYYSLDRKIEDVKNKLSKEIDSVRGELGGRIDSLKEHIHGLETRVENLEGRVDRIENRISNLERRIDVLETRVGEVARGLLEFREAFYSYQNTLIDFLAAKGVVTEPEAVLLRGSLKTLAPAARSRYYTEEVRKRLLDLLDKEIRDYTWEDVAELEKIAEAIDREARETGREDLIKYYPKLMMYIAIVKGLLRRREMEKKEKQTKE